MPNPVPIMGLFPSSPIRNQMSCLRGVQLKANGAPCKVRVNLSASGKGVHLLVMGYAEFLQSYAIRKLFHKFSHWVVLFWAVFVHSKGVLFY